MTYSACSEILISKDLEIISLICTVPSRTRAQTGSRCNPDCSQTVKLVIHERWSWCWPCSVSNSTRWVKSSVHSCWPVDHSACACGYSADGL